MPVAHLHPLLIGALIPRMSGWKFVARDRHFRRRHAEEILWFMHPSFINHNDDFDAVVDVAVKFTQGKKSLCVVGAQLGNIAGIGQTRFKVTGPHDIPGAVEGILKEFQTVGMPFLDRFSHPAEVLSVLKQGGREAGLISPITARHAEQIRALEQLIHAT